jgi:hypothetical protein
MHFYSGPPMQFLSGVDTQPHDRTPVIWAAAAGLLDDAADAIERVVSRHSSIFRKK